MIIKNFLLALIPKNKVVAWLIGLVIAGAAAVAGISASDLQVEVCKSAPVKIDMPQPVVEPATTEPVKSTK